MTAHADAAGAGRAAPVRLHNRVLAVLFVAGAAAALGTGFVTLAPNRLLSGRPIGLFAAADLRLDTAIAIFGLALLAAAFAPPRRALHLAAAALASALLFAVLAAAGQSAASLASEAPRLARVSLGAGFWILLTAAALAIVDGLQRAGTGIGARLAVAAGLLLGFALMARAGMFDALSLAKEYQSRQPVFAAALLRHIVLVAAAVGPAIAIGFPLAVAAVRRPNWQGPIFAVLNLLQTVPSIALFGLLLVPLSGLAAAFPSLAAIGIGGIGMAPAIIALILYALLPVVRNGVAGLAGVDAGVLDAGRGMGLSPRQLFWRVELPLSMPLLLAGLRIVIVQAIGLAVVAALIGAGGLGTFVFEGLGQYAADLVLLGALPAIGLALAADFLLQSLAELLAPPMIEVEHVGKAFGDRTVVEDLSLSVPEGAFCVLLGPSGCGKSTTLRMINRLVPFDSGSIRVGGQDVGAVPPEELRRRIGYAIQSIGLFPHWRIEDNIATVPRLLRWPRQRVQDRVTELLQLLRLDPETYRGKYPHQLSGGEQQRVGVARALAGDPDVLLMDEPFAAVDPVTRAALQDEMLRIQRETEKTVVFVTHDIEEALRLASVIAVMERGRLAQWGTPVELLEHPASDFVAEFVGGDGAELKLLGLRRVADRLHPGEPADGEPIAADASLREALAAMAARRVDRLAVVDMAGRPVGAITLADLVR